MAKKQKPNTEQPNVLLISILVLACFSLGCVVTNLIMGDTYQKNCDTNLYEEVGNRFREIRTYDNNTYNCINYSKDYALLMNLLGYETYVMYNYNESHAYNLVALDPQEKSVRTIKYTK